MSTQEQPAQGHTPTPSGFTVAQVRAIADDLRLMKVAGQFPARLGEADPERIDWICNAHDELVGALEKCHDWLAEIEQDSDGPQWAKEKDRAILVEARAALAKARQEGGK